MCGSKRRRGKKKTTKKKKKKKKIQPQKKKKNQKKKKKKKKKQKKKKTPRGKREITLKARRSWSSWGGGCPSRPPRERVRERPEGERATFAILWRPQEGLVPKGR